MNSAQICDTLYAEYGTTDVGELDTACAPEPMVEAEERNLELTRRERKMLGMCEAHPLVVAVQELVLKVWETFKEVVRTVKLNDIWTAYQVQYMPDHMLSPRQRQLKRKGVAPLLSSYRRTFGNATVPAYRPIGASWRR